ncbi:MAG: crossover junction endodeoxyribonuclease RuvC [Nitrospirota bacterium]|nr:crossover junction endodeoxyribonuclease RuvC [Nitrospirota bacterium]
MIVLGVDPGTVATGYGVVAGEGNRFHCLTAGDIRSSARNPMEMRLLAIFDCIESLIAEFHPDAVAVETAFISKTKSPQTPIKLGQARGVILLAAARAGLPVVDVNPVTVKQTVAGNGAAPKEQVIYMIKRLLNLPGDPPSEHAADALGIALCHIQRGRYEALAAGATQGRRR